MSLLKILERLQEMQGTELIFCKQPGTQLKMHIVLNTA